MPTLKVVLTKRQEEWIESLVSSGHYRNSDEVLRAGIRLLERQAAEDEACLRALRDATRPGVSDIEEGRFRSFDAPEPLRRRLSNLAEEAIAGSAAGSEARG